MKVLINWHEIEDFEDLITVMSLFINGFNIPDETKQNEVLKKIQDYEKKNKKEKKTKNVFVIQKTKSN